MQRDNLELELYWCSDFADLSALYKKVEMLLEGTELDIDHETFTNMVRYQLRDSDPGMNGVKSAANDNLVILKSCFDPQFTNFIFANAEGSLEELSLGVKDAFESDDYKSSIMSLVDEIRQNHLRQNTEAERRESTKDAGSDNRKRKETSWKKNKKKRETKETGNGGNIWWATTGAAVIKENQILKETVSVSLPESGTSKSPYIAGMKAALGLMDEYDEFEDSRQVAKGRLFAQISLDKDELETIQQMQPNFFSNGFKDLWRSRKPIPNGVGGKTARLKKVKCNHKGCSCAGAGLPEVLVWSNDIVNKCTSNVISLGYLFQEDIIEYDIPTGEEIVSGEVI